jgi:hypothetical protein
MSIFTDLGLLGCLAAVSPMIILKSVAFPRPTSARSAVVQFIAAARVVDFVELLLDAFGGGAASLFPV